MVDEVVNMISTLFKCQGTFVCKIVNSVVHWIVIFYKLSIHVLLINGVVHTKVHPFQVRVT